MAVCIWMSNSVYYNFIHSQVARERREYLFWTEKYVAQRNITHDDVSTKALYLVGWAKRNGENWWWFQGSMLSNVL